MVCTLGVLDLSKPQRLHSIKTFSLDWLLHPEVRRFAPADIHLEENKELLC